MFKHKYRLSVILSALIIILAVVASAGGIFIKGIYTDNAFTQTAWYGNDLVTLFLAVPLMIIALGFAMRDSKKALLIWMGTLWYMVDNYIFYLYAAAFNRFFLLYVALFTFSMYALIFALVQTDAEGIAKRFSPRTPIQWVGGYQLFFAVFLGGLWLIMVLQANLSGKLPVHVEQTGHPTAVVFATDLSLLIPALIVSAILLLKKQPWGYVLSAIVLVKSFTYSLVLIVMSVVAVSRGGQADPFIVLWIVLSAACLGAMGSLLGNIKD